MPAASAAGGAALLLCCTIALWMRCRKRYKVHPLPEDKVPRDHPHRDACEKAILSLSSTNKDASAKSAYEQARRAS